MNEDGYSAEVFVDFEEIDEGLRPASLMRVAPNEEAIERYVEDFDKLPPVLLIHDPSTGKHWVPDGLHRCTAAVRLSRGRIKARVKSGSYVDAFHDACVANDTHGVRVSNADKRLRISRAFDHPEMGRWSSHKIADLCGVDHAFVLRYRPVAVGDGPHLPEGGAKVIGKDGKSYPAKKPRKDKASKAPAAGKAPRAAKVRSVVEPSSPTNGTPSWDESPAVVAPASPVRVEGEPFDMMGRWRVEEALIMDRYQAWPEDARGIFVMHLESLGFRLRTRFHPDIEDLTHSSLI